MSVYKELEYERKTTLLTVQILELSVSFVFSLEKKRL